MLMKKNKNSERRRGILHGSWVQPGSIVGAYASTLGLSLMLTWPAQAQTVQLGDFTVTLQSTFGYTLGVRTASVNNESSTLNNDDGDRNFRSGIMADRFQTLEQLNIANGNYGLRASALAYVDTVYLQNNKNNSPNTFNSYDVGPQGFPSATVDTEGRKFRPLAVFLYGSENFAAGEQKLSWQLGRQTITWGESLFSLDGISGLQAPVDFYEAELLPNPQAQALFLPTGAASVSYNFSNGIALDAYWQFEYESDILPGTGSYFASNSDYVGPGAQRILATPINEGAVSIYRAPDINPPNGLDQLGLAAHDTFGNFGVGAYYVRGIPKTPNVYTNITGVPGPGPSGPSVGVYNLAYSKPVDAFALSASTLFKGANIAAEISGRINQPLLSEPTYTAAHPASYNNPLYATGDVLDAQISGIYLTPPLPLMPNGASISAELTLNDVVSVTKNKAVLLPGYTNEGGGFEVVFAPNWFPLAAVEIETPIGWTKTFLGDSRFDQSAAGASTIDVGIEAIYKSNLTVGINYQRYAGPPNRQANLDRDFLTFYVQRTF